MKDGDVTKEQVKDVPFTTVANLVTALFMELQKTYVTGHTLRDKKMRKRIEKTVEIVNDHQEIANLIIKGNPFHNKHHSNSGRGQTEGGQPKVVKEAAADQESSNSSD